MYVLLSLQVSKSSNEDLNLIFLHETEAKRTQRMNACLLRATMQQVEWEMQRTQGWGPRMADLAGFTVKKRKAGDSRPAGTPTINGI
jgi:hypothetical protein